MRPAFARFTVSSRISRLEDVVADRRNQRLNDEDIFAAHAGQQPHKNVVIRKADDLARADGHAQAFANFLGQVWTRRSSKHANIPVSANIMSHAMPSKTQRALPFSKWQVLFK